MKINKILEILGKFKSFCRCRGWNTSESEDWIEMNEIYHNFLSAREVHPASFKRIASDKKCVVRKGLAYNVVEASYTAWLFSETPTEDVVRTISENPDFCKKTALFDLSQVGEGKNLCILLNKTDSHVFQEFESFLQNELKVKLKHLPPSLGGEVDTHRHETMAIA